MTQIIKKEFDTQAELYTYIKNNFPPIVEGVSVTPSLFYCNNCNKVIVTDQEFLTFFMQNLPGEDPRTLIQNTIECCTDKDINILIRNDLYNNYDYEWEFYPSDPRHLIIIPREILYGRIIANKVLQ